MKKIILGIILVGILFLVGCQEVEECPECIECPEEKAMLSIELKYWGENIDNENEVLFDYYIYNYGYKEAKDVTVKCVIKDEDDNIKKSIVDDIGNIASTSSTFKETVMTLASTREGFMGYCYVEGCSNCDILHKRIPSLKTQLEKPSLN